MAADSWQRGIAIGWKVADIQADAGRVGRALGERETANRGRGCQASLPRIRLGVPTPIFWTLKFGLDRSDMFRPPGSRLEAPAYPRVAPVARAFISSRRLLTANAEVPRWFTFRAAVVHAPSAAARRGEADRSPGCPSSDDLRQFTGLQKGGSGSPVIEIMRHAVDAASDGLRLSGA
jgi:hypothetical protein